jgi:LPXTG-site transpeptidase (sortase) family protein
MWPLHLLNNADPPTPRPWAAAPPSPIRDPRSFSLLREFLEQMVAEQLELRARSDPSAVVPEFDWNKIWAAAEGCTSEEQAIGNVVLAAYLAARGGQAVRGHVQEYYAVPPVGPVEPGGRQPDPLSAQGVRPVVSGNTLVAPRPLDAEPWERSPSTEEGPSKERRRLMRRRGLATLFGWIRNLGIVILLFVAWQLWGTSISQHHAQQQLQSTFEASLHVHHTASSGSNGPGGDGAGGGGGGAGAGGPVLISAKKQVPVPPEGTPVAQIEIPAIDLSEYVVSGTAEGDLAKGPGHYIGTAAPGQAGNVAIAGHRTTNGAPFNRLGQLTVGDQIYLTTSSGERLTYVVSQAPVAVSPSDVTVLDNFGDNRITLTTCNPEFSSSQRLIVVGELKQPKPPVAQGTPRAYHVVDSKTASWNWSSLPVVVIEAGVLILLGLSYRRFAVWFGGLSRWIVLLPIWLAGLYLLFQSLATFLPAAV